MTASAKKTPARKAAARNTKAAPKSDGRALMEMVIKAANAAGLRAARDGGHASVGGVFVRQPSGSYVRLQVEGKTVAYVVGGKTVATVYPNTLAESMPKAVRFKKVALGKHHYGSGEVVVPVEGEKDVPNAVSALKASMTAPPARGRGKATA